MKPKLCISFDAEEFDMPQEYGIEITEEEQMKIARNGLIRVLQILDKLKIPATFFVTAHFAKKNKELIRTLSKHHEVASHGLRHAGIKKGDLTTSKQILENITGKKIIGFRSPRLQKIPYINIAAAGYMYDSSINPTYIPGRYNNFFTNKNPHFATTKKGTLHILPTTVSTPLRIPLFWLSFKNLPLPIFKTLTKIALRKDGYLNMYFHPWEFTDITTYKLPRYVQKHSGDAMAKKLTQYLQWLQKQGTFTTITEYSTQIRSP